MKSHSEILIPHHSEHLWRYTPWKRMHPTEPHDVPESRQMSITGAELIPSDMLTKAGDNKQFACSDSDCPYKVGRTVDIVYMQQLRQERKEGRKRRQGRAGRSLGEAVLVIQHCYLFL